MGLVLGDAQWVWVAGRCGREWLGAYFELPLLLFFLRLMALFRKFLFSIFSESGQIQDPSILNQQVELVSLESHLK